jgi:hypothetical protein
MTQPSKKSGICDPLDRGFISVMSIHFAACMETHLAAVPWDVVVIDKAHKLRNAHRKSHETGQALKRALAGVTHRPPPAARDLCRGRRNRSPARCAHCRPAETPAPHQSQPEPVCGALVRGFMSINPVFFDTVWATCRFHNHINPFMSKF